MRRRGRRKQVGESKTCWSILPLKGGFSACLTRHESLEHIHWLAACRERVGMSDVRRVAEFTRLRNGQSITVAESWFAPRTKRWFAERTTTVIGCPTLRRTMDDELNKQEQYPVIGQSVGQATTPTPWGILWVTAGTRRPARQPRRK